MFVSLLAAVIGVLCLTNATAGDKDPERYLERVRSYADTMLEEGRDRWGRTDSPLFAITLKRKNHELLKPDKGKVRQLFGRPAVYDAQMWGATANPSVQAGLYRVLIGLSELTGDDKYADAVDEAMRYFWKNCQDPSGTMSWGEEAAWHLKVDGPCSYMSHARLHEPYAYPFFERTYRLGPEVRWALHLYAYGTWKYTMGDHEKTIFSRHYHPDVWPGGSRGGAEYPRLIGQFLHTWAMMYEKAGAQIEKGMERNRGIHRTMRKAIKRLSSNALSWCKPSGVLPNTRKGNKFWGPQNLLVMRKLHNAAGHVPDELAEPMEKLEDQQRDVILNKLDHPMTREKGYASRGQARPLKAKQYTSAWGIAPKDSRGSWNTGFYALSLFRYDDVVGGDSAVRKLALRGADLYVKGPDQPDYPTDLNAAEMGYVLQALARAYEVSGKTAYLERAKTLAEDAVDMFFDDHSPLPRGARTNRGVKGAEGNVYAAGRYDDVWGGGADDLMLGLLKLHLALANTGEN